MRIYFTGASGVGKSTLASHVHNTYGLPMLPSAARLVSVEFGIKDPHEILSDVKLADTYQQQVFKKQCDAEWNARGNFVSDRAFDNICYATEFGNWCMTIPRSDEWHKYIEGLKKSDVLIFFVRPPASSFARVKDGWRDPFAEPAWVNRQDGIIQFILESNRISYIPIASERLRDRIRLVDAVIGLFKRAN